MIVKEFHRVREDGLSLFRTYSDNGFMVRKDGTEEIYAEAIDIEDAPYTYIETDVPIEPKDEADLIAENADMKSALNVLGVK